MSSPPSSTYTTHFPPFIHSTTATTPPPPTHTFQGPDRSCSCSTALKLDQTESSGARSLPDKGKRCSPRPNPPILPARSETCSTCWALLSRIPSPSIAAGCVRSLASSLSTRPPMACGGSTVRLFDCSTGSPFGLHWRCCGASCALPVPALRLHPMVSLALASKLKPGRLAAERRSTTPASREQKTGCHADTGRWALDRSLMVAGSFAANRLLATGSGTPKLPPKFPATCRATSSRECVLATTPLLASLR